MSRAGNESGEGTDEPRLPGPLGPEPSDDEIDRRFAELTAALAPSGATTDPDSTDGRDEATDADDEPDQGDAADQGDGPPSSTPLTLAAGPRDYALAPEPDEGFVPPDPEPLDSMDPLQLAAWVGAVVGPLAAIVLLVVWPSAPTAVWLTALGVTLGGWGVVIWRLPRHRDDDDDGARV